MQLGINSLCICVSKMAKSALFVFVCMFLVDCGLSVDVLNSGDMLKVSIAGFKNVKSGHPSVSLMWGIPDVTAPIGRFFNFSIPPDAFDGENLVYKVTNPEKDALPSWLVFFPERKLLQGIPTESDRGQVYLEVVATGKDGQEAKDVFTITVTEDTGSPTSGSTTLRYREHGPKTVRCKRSQPETAVTIVLDVDLDKLGAQDRLDFLNRLVSHLSLAEDMLKISGVGRKPLNDASALVSGAGDAKALQTSGSFISWLVGCGKVEADHMIVLQQVENEAQTGVMSSAIRVPVHWWQVTNSRFQEHKRRKRQAIRATPTPGITPTLPVKGPTDTIRATGRKDHEMTRPVPTMDSPSFGIQPTKTMMEKTATPGQGGTPIAPTKAPDGLKPTSELPDQGPMTKTQVLPTKTYVVTDDVRPTKVTPKPTKTEGESTDVVTKDCKDRVPSVKNPIKTLDFSAGEYVKYKIPLDTFYDCRVGDTRKLKLSLYGNQTTVIPRDYWLKFDTKKKQIQAFPMEKDIGTYKFNLLAVTPNELDAPAKNPFTIEVKKNPNSISGELNHELTMTLDNDFDEFNSNIDKKIQFLNKVAKLYGQKNSKQLAMTRLARGSTIVAWTNKTLASPGCPVDAIKTMVGTLVNEDGTLTREAVQGMKPFTLKKAGAVPLGACENDPNFPSLPTTGTEDGDGGTGTVDGDGTSVDKDDSTAEPEPESTTEGVKTGSAGGAPDDMWITTVVPAVVIVAILLLALLVACILYRKKRKGKMNLEDQNTFVNKGVPVIFQDELEEKPTDSAKPLLLEGQPPCPPPEYQRGDSQSSTPPLNHKQPQYIHDEDHIEDTNVNSPLYQPPPPVTASSGNKQPRPHVAQPAYRSQPPSIPP